MKYKITEIRVEGDLARITLEEVEPLGDSFARTLLLTDLRSMSLEQLKETFKTWIIERQETLKSIEEKEKLEEEASKEFERLKGEEIEVM